MTQTAGQAEAEVPYPPAPWRFTGQSWMGVYQVDRDVPLPSGLQRILRPRWAIVALVRYLDGTLRYDELAVGALARRGWRVGLWVDQMWVDSLPSLWGGRHIWGLPKQLAEFTWTNNQVHVSDQNGLIAALTVDLQPARLPAIWALAPYFGTLPGQWAFTVARIWAHMGRSGMQIDDWSTRFPYQVKQPTPILSLSAKPFRMTFPAPRLLLNGHI
jgi:hypothetical protein